MFGEQQRRAKAPPRLTPADLARKIFLTKYNLQLVPGVIEWLEQLVELFQIEDENEIINTFEHLVKGIQGSGSGLGERGRVFGSGEGTPSS
jgi:hypothetical protein